jgi:hypothetical protein
MCILLEEFGLQEKGPHQEQLQVEYCKCDDGHAAGNTHTEKNNHPHDPTALKREHTVHFNNASLQGPLIT